MLAVAVLGSGTGCLRLMLRCFVIESVRLGSQHHVLEFPNRTFNRRPTGDTSSNQTPLQPKSKHSALNVSWAMTNIRQTQHQLTHTMQHNSRGHALQHVCSTGCSSHHRHLPRWCTSYMQISPSTHMCAVGILLATCVLQQIYSPTTAGTHGPSPATARAPRTGEKMLACFIKACQCPTHVHIPLHTPMSNANPSLPTHLRPCNMHNVQLTGDTLREMTRCCAAATGTL